ncbi:hypothetical protein Hypma_006655 [Hypsizygus marmoreus]|uniref:Uncharacterized protein n=1 Tax=Hypsizygus marmoreus TaxID=39966 RepID=A0A369JXU1_HYPMA|nr:hypothetical protein Hypma_006655 [Hypsizygus marmoreus]
MSYVYASAHAQPWPQAEVVGYNAHYAQPYAVPSSAVLRPLQPPVPVSSYSSLSGALDPPSTSSGRNRSYSIHKSRSNATAYPVSHHDTPRTYSRSRSHSQLLSPEHLCAPSPSRSSRNTRHHGQVYAEDVQLQPARVVPIPRAPSGPTNHVLVPQIDFKDDETLRQRSYMDPHFRHEDITFQTVGIPELGVRVGKIAERYSPAIVHGDDQVFKVTGDMQIKLWIIWPGYSAEPMQRRMKTQNGTATRDFALAFIANAILDFTYSVYKSKVPVECGREEWTIGPRADKRPGVVGAELFITRLIHRGGSNWQPEIWAPRRS